MIHVVATLDQKYRFQNLVWEAKGKKNSALTYV